MVEWLGTHFSIFGIHFQNWMPVAAAIVVLYVLYPWIKGRRS